MSFFALLKIELLKVKRTLGVLALIGCPLFMTILMFLITLETGEKRIPEGGWMPYWMGIDNFWAYMMMPLYIALIGALINSIEHKNQAWRTMMSLPINPKMMYFTKFLVVWLFLMGAVVLLYAFGALSILALQAFGIDGPNAWDHNFLIKIGTFGLAALPITVIQHAVSWRFSSFVAPMILSIVMMVAGSQVMSSKYWVYDPWTYTITALSSSNAQSKIDALTYAGISGIILLIATTLWLGRRELRN